MTTQTMTVNEFMLLHIPDLKKIISEIESKQFDSHEFIRRFAKFFELDYIGFLASYEETPFKTVHSQIALFLASHINDLDIDDIGTTNSPNVFGIISKNELWRKR